MRDGAMPLANIRGSLFHLASRTATAKRAERLRSAARCPAWIARRRRQGLRGSPVPTPAKASRCRGPARQPPSAGCVAGGARPWPNTTASSSSAIAAYHRAHRAARTHRSGRGEEAASLAAQQRAKRLVHRPVRRCTVSRSPSRPDAALPDNGSLRGPCERLLLGVALSLNADVHEDAARNEAHLCVRFLEQSFPSASR